MSWFLIIYTRDNARCEYRIDRQFSFTVLVNSVEEEFKIRAMTQVCVIIGFILVVKLEHSCEFFKWYAITPWQFIGMLSS
jgi:hypothetical protein